MKEELNQFGENDLVLGVRPIYFYVQLRYGGNTVEHWDRSNLNLVENIVYALCKCDNIQFIVTDIIPNPLLFKEKILPRDNHYANFEMQTILLKQELFEKTRWYNVDRCGHNSVYEVENLREVRIQDVLKDI